MTSLRQQILGLPQDPGIRILLPSGWEALPLDDEHVADLTKRLRPVFMRANRPDLDAYVSGLIDRWLTELRAQGGLFAILPSGVDAVLPMSLVVSVVAEHDGSQLDGWVANRLRGGRAEFLDDEQSILTWSASTLGTGEMSGTVTDQYNYLIPVPRADRRRALLLTGSNLVAADATQEDPARVAAQSLYDAIALAMVWVDQEA